MRIKPSQVDRITDIFIYAIGILIMIVVAYPMYFMLIASFSNPTELATGRVWFWPSHFSLSGYEKIFEYKQLWVGYRNTIFYAVSGTLVTMCVNILAAYSLSRKQLRTRRVFMVYFMIIMFFNGGLIPTYFVINSLHMVDTIWVMIIPGSVNVFFIIIARTFFQSTIPQELLDASVIDGCGNGKSFFQIVLPLSKPILAVIALYSIVGQWNSYMTALIYTSKPELTTLQIVLRKILIMNEIRFDSGSTGTIEEMRLKELLKYGAIVVSTLPVLTVYPFLQKYFAQGIMIGSIKG